MMYGLDTEDIVAIKKVFSNHDEIEQAILYGSRAKGNYRNDSDIDLTLKGENLTLSQLFAIETELDDLLIPYKIDLSIYHKIENQDLIAHIKRVGVVFYQNEKSMSEWKEGILTDVAEIIMGQSPKGETCNNKGDGIPLLNGPTEFGIKNPFFNLSIG